MTVSATLGECEYLVLAFSPTSAPLRARWRNNGLSADFLGDYVTTFLPTQNGGASLEKQQNEIKYAVTYIANELLENAMKYHQHEVDIPIKLYLELASDHITVSVSNGIACDQATHYRGFLEGLQQEDACDQIIRRQEESAKDSASSDSCLGLLTMICDYNARIQWSFDPLPAQPELMTVTTSSVLPLDVSGVSA